MIGILTQFGSSSSGIGALGFDFSSFIIQLITFIIAFLILRKWAFKPILKVMNDRRLLIEKGVELGEQMQKEQADMEDKVETTLHEARAEADGIISGAQETARQTVREAEDKARDKAAAVTKDAEERIVQETARARQKLEQDVVGLISEATEAIIEEKVDAKKDAQLIDKVLKERAHA